MSKKTTVVWWRKTRILTVITLAVWAIFGFGIPFFAAELNEFSFIGFPLGYYMTAQGSVIVFVVAIFWMAHRQDAVDRDFGVAEDD